MRTTARSLRMAAVLVLAVLPAPAVAVSPGVDAGVLTFSTGGGLTAEGPIRMLSVTDPVSDPGGTGLAPAWSPDGTQLAFWSGRDDPNGDIYTFGPFAQPVVNATRVTTYEGLDEPAVWAPDGGGIAYVSSEQEHNELYVRRGGQPQRLTFATSSEISGIPDFSPDGTLLVVAGANGLVVFPAGAPGIGRPLTGDATDAEPSWSPDGTRILFSSSRTGNRDIWVVDASGNSAPQQLTTSTSAESDPAWSPDGSVVAYEFREGAALPEIRVMTPTGGNQRTITRGAVDPTFRPSRPAPAIAALGPASAAAGGPSVTVSVTGTGFMIGSRVRWNGLDRPTTLVSSTQLTVQIPAADLAATGTALVSVATPAPGGGTSAALPFTVTAAGAAGRSGGGGGGGGGTTQGPGGGTGAAAGVLTVTRATATGGWRVSRLAGGRVRITGRAARAASLRVRIQGAGGVSSATRPVPAGAFTLTVPLAATTPPGPLRVTLTEPSPPAGAAALSASTQTVLAGPPEGVVGSAVISTAPLGVGRPTIPAGVRVLYARFRFVTPVPTRRALTVTWTLGGFRRTFPTERPAGRTAVGQIGSIGGGTLGRGTWVATLRSGGTTVARARIRVR